MKHIFVSHAGNDKAIASRLADDLKNAGHDTKVDTRELRLGQDTIEFMNQGIADAHTIIILYSCHTPTADWQKLEINAALWNEVAQEGGTCIVIRLDDTQIPPILGPKVYGKLNPNDNASYASLLKEICAAILPNEPVSSLLSQAFRTVSGNPFRRVRAEYFEDRPDLLAKTFAPPDALKMGALEEMKPCFLEGSRGTGKSMLLLSLRARNFRSRYKQNPPSDVFGFYLKLSRGAICNVGVALDSKGDPKTSQDPESAQIVDIASQELIVCLLESLLSEVAYCIAQTLLPSDRATDRALADSIHLALFGQASTPPHSIEDLLDSLANIHRDIANFIRRRFIYGENPPVPIATFDLESLKRVIRLVRRLMPALTNSMFVVLLDEYENLFPYQQRVVNGFVKFAPPEFSVKIAKKLGSADISGTTTGQELQETHDYTRLTLVYDVEDSSQLSAYHELLGHILTNVLRSEGLKETNVKDLLPVDTRLQVDEDKLIVELATLCGSDLATFRNWPEEKKRERRSYYGEAAIYRVLYGTKGQRHEKRFSGFQDLAFVSSGVIRYFQEMLGVAYHLTYGSVPPPTNKSIVLPPEKQSQAVHFVSEHNLTTLSRNVETYGEALKYFILDLGDCLRHKLQKHGSEPEAARLTIEDPELLDQPYMAPLKRLLDVGVREGVFQTKEGRPAFKPKHHSDPQPSEFNLSRIYAPVLQISPRLRWRTRVGCKALVGLAIPAQRAEALRQLKAQMIPSQMEERATEQTDLHFKDL